MVRFSGGNPIAATDTTPSLRHARSVNGTRAHIQHRPHPAPSLLLTRATPGLLLPPVVRLRFGQEGPPVRQAPAGEHGGGQGAPSEASPRGNRRSRRRCCRRRRQQLVPRPLLLHPRLRIKPDHPHCGWEWRRRHYKAIGEGGRRHSQGGTVFLLVCRRTRCAGRREGFSDDPRSDRVRGGRWQRQGRCGRRRGERWKWGWRRRRIQPDDHFVPRRKRWWRIEGIIVT